MLQNAPFALPRVVSPVDPALVQGLPHQLAVLRTQDRKAVLDPLSPLRETHPLQGSLRQLNQLGGDEGGHRAHLGAHGLDPSHHHLMVG